MRSKITTKTAHLQENALRFTISHRVLPRVLHGGGDGWEC